jgi:hypothetical protein
MRNTRYLCSPHTLYAGLRLKQWSVAALLEPRVAREFVRFARQDATLSAQYLGMGRNGRTAPIVGFEAQQEAVDFVSTEMLLASAPSGCLTQARGGNVRRRRRDPEAVMAATVDERLLAR